MYGVNDVQNSDEIYNDVNGTIYLLHILGTALTLSIPQNKIQDPRDSSWTKVGSWANAGAYTFGLSTSTINGYIEKNVGTAPTSTSPTFTPIGTIFDLGEDTPNCIATIINKDLTTNTTDKKKYRLCMCLH